MDRAVPEGLWLLQQLHSLFTNIARAKGVCGTAAGSARASAGTVGSGCSSPLSKVHFKRLVLEVTKLNGASHKNLSSFHDIVEQQNNHHMPRKNTSLTCKNPIANKIVVIFMFCRKYVLQNKPMLKTIKIIVISPLNNVHLFFQLYNQMAS